MMTLEEAIKLLKEERELLQSEGDPEEFPSALKCVEALDIVFTVLEELETRRRKRMGEMCNECYRAIQNCHDRSICCEMEEYDGDECGWFEPMPLPEAERENNGCKIYRHN